MSEHRESLAAGGTWKKSISQARYILFVLPTLVLQYCAALLPRMMDGYGQSNGAEAPDRWLGADGWTILVCVVGVVVFCCTVGIGWLSARRAATIQADRRVATLSVVPWLQLLAIGYLACTKSRRSKTSSQSMLVMRGALWGLGITFLAELVFTLALGDFGIALFVGSPFVVGIVTSYLAKRDGDPNPIAAAQMALLLASLILFGFAFEGLICLIIAYPLASLAALLGSLCGRWLAHIRAPGSTALSSVVMLPLLFAIEIAEPPLLTFNDTRSVDVSAPPDVVWAAIVHMGKIEDAPAAPFGWGLAYPVAGRINGSGVGAIRLGVFSTGIAYERVTRWEMNRELWFDVLSDPPMMRETNPFGPIHPTHLTGYFMTHNAHFSLKPLPRGKTRLTLATEHELKIAPTSYFGTLARWAVSENKRRVLAHFKQLAEKGSAAYGEPVR